MRVWITRFALTTAGVVERQGVKVAGYWEDGIEAGDESDRYSMYYPPWDWYETEEDALNVALMMVDKELESQVTHLDSLRDKYQQRLNEIRGLENNG